MAYTTPPTFVAGNALAAAQLNILGDDIVYLNTQIPTTLLTTRGDLIYRNATVPARLALGASGTFLKSNGTDPAWTALAASDIASGQLALARGGTNADLSATGGTGRVLKQTSAGAAVTVAALVTADLPSSIRCRAYNNANISINNATTTAITLNSERWDTDTMHSTSSNTSRLTATTAGLYVITASVDFAANATGVRSAQLQVNGATVIALSTIASAGAGNDTVISLATTYYLNATDYVEMLAFQNSGGALNVVSGANYSPELSAVWIGV